MTKPKPKDEAEGMPMTDEAPAPFVFGPCGDCSFYVSGEGLGQAVGKGRCHGMPPISGMWPAIPAVAAGCSLFRARS